MARRKKPTKIAEAEGYFRHDPQRRPKGEPQGEFKAMKMPEHIAENAVASARWSEVVDQLERLEVLAITDPRAIEVHVLTYAEWRQTDPKLNAWHKLSDRLFKQFNEFGFTPSSRTKIQVPNKTDSTSPLQELKLRMGKTG